MFQLALVVLATQAAAPHLLACTACFGKSDSNMAQGMNMGIFVLLLVITMVLAGVASFFVFIAKRTSQMEAAQHPNFPTNRTNA